MDLKILPPLDKAQPGPSVNPAHARERTPRDGPRDHFRPKVG